MCKQHVTFVVGLLMLVLGARAEDVYYRWSRSGDTTVSTDCKTIHFNSGASRASACLTVRGSGRLTFSAKGAYAFYYKKDGQGGTNIAYDSAREVTIDFSGEAEHTIEWYTDSNPYYYYSQWGEISSVTWKGSTVLYSALVELDPNGGECDDALCHVKFGAQANSLPSATKQSFTFLGWYTGVNGGEKVDGNYAITSDMVVHAHWKANPNVIITPASGTIFDNTLTVTIDCSDEEAAIYYTLDGSEPSAESTPYHRFRITGKTTVKAIAEKNGAIGDVAVAHYALGTCTDPVISLADGSVFQHSNQVISIDWTETDGTLRYTLDGSEPTETSAEYTGPFTISETTTVKAKVFSDKFFDSNVVTATFTREWVKVATPVIAANATFAGSKTRVVMSCASDGAIIRYTTDGSTPDNNSSVYSRAFFVTNSCTIKAYATLDDSIDSDVASMAIEQVWGTGDSLGVPDLVFSSGGNASWVRDTTVFKRGTDSMRSGGIGNEQSSELSTTVNGKGTFSFWWKTSCEDSGGFYDWDHAEFHADGQVYYLDGETDWTQVVHEFTTEGIHELRWIYLKDNAGKDGSDCVWIDNLEWAGDPIPNLGETPDTDEVDDALFGSADDNLYRHVTDGSKYNAYRNWVDKACGSDFAKRQAVKDSVLSWLSFALDAEALIGEAPKQGDLSVDQFEPADVDGAFALTCSLPGITIGENATAANLAEVFGIEGAAELNEAAFSSEGLTVNLQRTADGKAKATVTPEGTPSSFFMRVKMK